MALNYHSFIATLLPGTLPTEENLPALPTVLREPTAKELETYIDAYLTRHRHDHTGNVRAPIFRVPLPDNTIVPHFVGTELSRTYSAAGWVSCRHQAGIAGNLDASFVWMS